MRIKFDAKKTYINNYNNVVLQIKYTRIKNYVCVISNKSQKCFKTYFLHNNIKWTATHALGLGNDFEIISNCASN